MTSNNPVFYISGEKSYYVPELNLTVDDADDMESLYEYDVVAEPTKDGKIKFYALCKVDRMMLYKICGVYNFVIKYCPNRKVVHLIKYGKNERVRNKNFNRALMILIEMISKNNWEITVKRGL